MCCMGQLPAGWVSGVCHLHMLSGRQLQACERHQHGRASTACRLQAPCACSLGLAGRGKQHHATLPGVSHLNDDDVSQSLQAGTKSWQGGFGKVVLCELNGQQVAVKMDVCQKKACVPKEALNLGRLAHSRNVVKLLGVSNPKAAGGYAVLVMHYYKHGALTKYTKGGGVAAKTFGDFKEAVDAYKDAAQGECSTMNFIL